MRPFDDIVRLERAEILDKPAAAVRGVVDRACSRTGRSRTLCTACGSATRCTPGSPRWPPGSFISATLLDTVGRPVGGGRAPSSFLIAAGLAPTPPTAAAGWADWSESHEDQQRVGLVHAAANIAAVAPLRRGARPPDPRHGQRPGCCRSPAGLVAGRGRAARRPHGLPAGGRARTTPRTSRTSAPPTGSRSGRWPSCPRASPSAGPPATCRCSCCAGPTVWGPTDQRARPTAARTCPRHCTRATRRRRRRGAHRVPVARQRVPGVRRLRRARPGDRAGAAVRVAGDGRRRCRRGSCRSRGCRRADGSGPRLRRPGAPRRHAGPDRRR